MIKSLLHEDLTKHKKAILELMGRGIIIINNRKIYCSFVVPIFLWQTSISLNVDWLK
jgi:hypothetical protein